jgi:hypothetical protein
VRVARGCCDTLMAQERLVAQVGSALVEKERRGRMPQGMSEMTGTRARWQASLRRALNALLLNGAPSRPGKTSARSREVGVIVILWGLPPR